MNLLFQIDSGIGTFEKISYILGGIALFLYGIHIMGKSLRDLAGDKLKTIIEKTTNTTLKGILVGIIITIILQSSSGTTGIIVALISAGLMTLPQGIAVIMGANIGTTVTSIIIGLDISEYSLIIAAIGALMCFFIKRQKIQYIGTSILGFGLIFFGLSLMGDTLILVLKEPFFEGVIESLNDKPILGILIGGLLTMIVQSSAATIGIVQKLYAEASTTFMLVGALPIVLGSNLGTTSTAMIASLGGSKNAKRAALSHVIFNVVGCLIFFILLKPYTNLVQLIEDTFFKQPSASTISVAHVIFNVVTTIILAFFVKQLVWLVNKIIKPTESEKLLSSIDQLNPQLLSTPSLALKASRDVILDMWNVVLTMWKNIDIYMFENSKGVVDEITNLENLTDIYDNKLHDYLAKLSTQHLSKQSSFEQTLYFDTTRDLERIADHIMNLCEFASDRYDYKVNYYPETKENVSKMMSLVGSMITNAHSSFVSGNKNLANNVLETEPLVDETEKNCCKEENILLLSNSEKRSEFHYVDILSNLERIADHLNNIAENICNNTIHDINE